MTATKNISKTIEELTALGQMKPWLKLCDLEVDRPYPILDCFRQKSKFGRKTQTILVLTEGQLGLPSRFNGMAKKDLENLKKGVSVICRGPKGKRSIIEFTSGVTPGSSSSSSSSTNNHRTINSNNRSERTMKIRRFFRPSPGSSSSSSSTNNHRTINSNNRSERTMKRRQTNHHNSRSKRPASIRISVKVDSSDAST